MFRALRSRHASRPVEDVSERLLHRIGFATHALDRFSERAGLGPIPYQQVEGIIRDLLRHEGLATTQRPHWARSHNTAALYLQAGEWMLFILQPDERRAGHYTCVTVVNGPADNDWSHALRRGYIHTPPPRELPALPSRRVRLWQSLTVARALRRQGRRDGSLLSQTLAMHRARQRQAHADHARVAAEITRRRQDHHQVRRRARDRHHARYGAPGDRRQHPS